MEGFFNGGAHTLACTRTCGGIIKMKRKIGTLIEEEVIKLVKHRAADEGRPLSDLIQDALVSYLSKSVPKPKEREAAYQIFCERPIKLSNEQFQEILEEDTWDL